MIKKINYLQLIIDLVVVFIGVTLAFIFTNYQDQKKQNNHTEKVVKLINNDLDEYEELFGGFAIYWDSITIDFQNNLEKGNIPNFENQTFPAPQYPIDAINLLTNQGFETLNPEVYVELAEYSNAIKVLMYVEQKLVDASEKYTHLPKDLEITRLQRYEQFKWAKNYLRYAKIRVRVSSYLEEKSISLKKILKENYPDYLTE